MRSKFVLSPGSLLASAVVFIAAIVAFVSTIMNTDDLSGEHYVNVVTQNPLDDTVITITVDDTSESTDAADAASI